MLKRWLSFVLLIFAALAGLDAVRDAACGGDLQERLFREGPPAWDALQQFSRHLDGAIKVTQAPTVTTKNPDFPVPRRSAARWIFRFDGDWALQQLDREDPSANDTGSDSPSLPASRAVGINSRYGFSIERRTPDSPWVVTSVVTTKYEGLRDQIYEGVLEYAEAPWVIFAKPLGTLIHEAGFRLESCEPVVQDGRELCKVTFDYSPGADSKEPTEMRGGWLVVDPVLSWAIREFNVKMRWGEVSGSHVYSDTDVTIPMLQEIHQRRTGKGGYTDWNVVFEKLEHRDSIPEAEFGLAQYGLPEPYGPLASGKSMRGPILILAGLLAIVVAGLLYYRVRNARAAQT